jgi:hypothetical protein
MTKSKGSTSTVTSAASMPLFADPALARDRTHLARLRECLHDESVSPLAIRRLVQRHPDSADLVFRALLRKPGFSWPRDGEKLLERHKKSYFRHEPGKAVVGWPGSWTASMHPGLGTSRTWSRWAIPTALPPRIVVARGERGR